jgi:hypothetical protein
VDGNVEDDAPTEGGAEGQAGRRGRGTGKKVVSQQHLDNLEAIRQARNAAKGQLKELRKRYKKDL